MQNLHGITDAQTWIAQTITRQEGKFQAHPSTDQKRVRYKLRNHKNTDDDLAATDRNQTTPRQMEPNQHQPHLESADLLNNPWAIEWNFTITRAEPTAIDLQ
jgi:hypothetical protein